MSKVEITRDDTLAAMVAVILFAAITVVLSFWLSDVHSAVLWVLNPFSQIVRLVLLGW